MKLKRGKYTKSIAQKIVGMLGQQFITNVGVVVKILKPREVSTKSIAIWNAGMKAIKKELKKVHQLGRVKMLDIQLYINGLLSIMGNQLSVRSVAQPNISIGQTSVIPTNETDLIGENYVLHTTNYMTTINKYCDVIRKRYDNFVSKK